MLHEPFSTCVLDSGDCPEVQLEVEENNAVTFLRTQTTMPFPNSTLPHSIHGQERILPPWENWSYHCWYYRHPSSKAGFVEKDIF